MQINPNLDANALNAHFAAYNRIEAPSFLREEDARALHAAIVSEQKRNLVFFANGRHYDLDAAGWRALDDLKKRQTEAIIFNEARNGFSYLYENVPIYDRWRAGRDLSPALAAAAEFLNSEPFLGFMRAMTGFADIAFADGQGTLYGPGHFLTLHNDDVEGKNRRAAFVLNLTPEWREDWGGYLNFFTEDGAIEEAMMPAFNTLRVFAVPVRHSVGYVAPFAGASRVAVTGWLRAGKDA